MKILMLCDYYNETLEFQENLLAKYYAKHGHQVVVVTSTYESVFDYYEGKHDNSVPSRTYFDDYAKIIKLRYRYNFLNKIRAFPSIRNILEEEAPDLVFLHGIMPNMLDAVAYKKKHPECVLILDCHADHSNSGKNWFSIRVLHGVIRKWLVDRARPYLSRIFMVVPTGLKFFHEVYKVPYEEMELLPLGADVDLGRQVRQSDKISELRKKYNLSEDSKVVFTGGKLSRRKKTELLIRAIRESDIDDLHLLIVGDASQDDHDYKALLEKEAGGQANIHFAGWLNSEEVYQHFAISDIAVFPASQSILWQQAISMGLPLVVGSVGGQSIEYLNLHDNIITLEEKDITPLGLRKVVEGLLRDKARYASMKEGAEKVTDECLDWNRLIEKTLRFCRDQAIEG